MLACCFPAEHHCADTLTLNFQPPEGRDNSLHLSHGSVVAPLWQPPSDLTPHLCCTRRCCFSTVFQPLQHPSCRISLLILRGFWVGRPSPLLTPEPENQTSPCSSRPLQTLPCSRYARRHGGTSPVSVFPFFQICSLIGGEIP